MKRAVIATGLLPPSLLRIHAFLISLRLPAHLFTLTRHLPTVSMHCIATSDPPSLPEAGPSRPGAPFSATYRTGLLC